MSDALGSARPQSRDALALKMVLPLYSLPKIPSTVPIHKSCYFYGAKCMIQYDMYQDDGDDYLQLLLLVHHCDPHTHHSGIL